MPDSLPLPNDPTARTPDGTIVDSRDLTPSPTPTSSTTPTPSETPDGNAPTTPPAATPAATVPDTYTFKAPEGGEVDQTLVDTFSPVFKELGLTQAQADKLTEAYNKHAQTQADITRNAIAEMGRQWETQTKADPELGTKLDQIKIDVGRALDVVLSPKEREAFQTAMNQTMIGNNPEFIRTFWKLAQRAAPGTHVAGGGPSPQGQSPTGQTQRPSVAASIWPNLKAS